MKNTKLLTLLTTVCLLALSACGTGTVEVTDPSSSTSGQKETVVTQKAEATEAPAENGNKTADPTATPTTVPATPTDTPTPTPTPTEVPVQEVYDSIDDYYGDYVTADGGSMHFYFDEEHQCHRIGDIVYNTEVDVVAKYQWDSSMIRLMDLDAIFTDDKIENIGSGFEVEMANTAARYAYWNTMGGSYITGFLAYELEFHSDGSIDIVLLDMGSGVVAKNTFTKVK